MKDLEELLDESAIDSETWADDLLEHFRQEGWMGPEAAREACEEVLAQPEAVAHPRWAELVRAAIAAPPLFEDIAEEIYGERIAFEDDEGGLDQGWDEYTTAVEVAALLGTDEAREHAQWADLARELIVASTVPGSSVELADELLLPAVEAGDARWAELVPAYLEADPYDFIGSFLDHQDVLSHPSLVEWLQPYRGYVMLIRELMKPRVAAHPVWPQLIELVRNEPSIRGDREFPKLAALVEERGL